MSDLKKMANKIRKALKDDEIIVDSDGHDKDIPVLSTGCMSLDIACGIMGLPMGRIVELYGPEGLGKSTVAMTAAACFQKKHPDGDMMFIDAEHAMDKFYAERIGVDFDSCLFSQPDSLEQATELVEQFLKIKEDEDPALVIIDSIASLSPEQEIEGGMGKEQIGLQARKLSKFFRLIKGSLNSNNTVLLCLNQLREKVGIVWGNPNITPGGKALKFYSSMRIELASKGKIKDGKKVIGNRVKAKLVKNKLAPPYDEAEFNIMFGEGIDRYDDIVGCGIDYGIVGQSGASFEYRDIRAQGRKQFVKKLKKAKLFNKLRKDIRKEI